MAGTLPGVECARRRRLRGSSGCDPSSAVSGGFGSGRIRFCQDTHLMPTSFLQRNLVNQSNEDEKLGGAAREAKERLDGRLRGHLKKEITRQNSEERLNGVGRRSTTTPIGMENMQLEAFGLKKKGLKMLSWGRMRLNWKSSKQDECVICLDRFKANEKVTDLLCAHRFHSECLLPWLESNAHCPCCRSMVFGTN